MSEETKPAEGTPEAPAPQRPVQQMEVVVDDSQAHAAYAN